ncbi:MAG TPA: phosphatase PAP2 family protein [Acidimicrobiales bacterium]|nr:phosphatase PAP2 family protein [Acidimicrobiales bacterium]
MTPVTGTGGWAGGVGHPGLRLAVGAAGLAATAALARRRQVGAREDRMFRAANDLPDCLYAPVWPVMQLGNLAAAPLAAGAALLAGERELAGRLLAGGSASWALSKVVKRAVGRARPAALLPRTRRRGREQSGLGYLSGHAAVAVALGAAALPHLGRRARLPVLVAMPVVGLCRLYVGAHLPLDVIGGASLGLAVEAAVAAVGGAQRPSARPWASTTARSCAR